jgi:hypothetical protein
VNVTTSKNFGVDFGDKMNHKPLESLIDLGSQLARDLEALAKEYHVKSDKHEILLWEASIVDAEVNRMKYGTEIIPNLQSSILFSQWDESLAEAIPEIAARVRVFHAAFNENEQCRTKDCIEVLDRPF